MSKTAIWVLVAAGVAVLFFAKKSPATTVAGKNAVDKNKTAPNPQVINQDDAPNARSNVPQTSTTDMTNPDTSHPGYSDANLYFDNGGALNTYPPPYDQNTDQLGPASNGFNQSTVNYSNDAINPNNNSSAIGLDD